MSQTKRIQLVIGTVLLIASPALAQAPKPPNAIDNPLAQVLLIIMILLMVAIGLMAGVVNGAATVYREKLRAEREAQKKSVVPLSTLVLLPILLLLSIPGFSQEALKAAPAIDTGINGLSADIYFAMMAVIVLEILVLIVLTYQLKSLLGIERKRKIKVLALPGVPKLSWWDKLNNSIALEKEKDIDLNHDYDGIRELDNPIPPWWMFGFVFFIVFGIGYAWRYHVAKSAPLQIEEYNIAMEKVEIEKGEYLKKSAGLVDENSITLLDAYGIAAGKTLFSSNCVACHGAEGEGAAVGPNLTDNYWIHGGSINDVFKTIKYGVPEKGMRSWKEDFSPIQMAQLTSYVESLKGSNPPNPKEPQGELYSQNASDSTDTKTDAQPKSPAP